MIDINEIENLAKSKQEENLKFRRYLKTYADAEKLDNDFKSLHEKYFEVYDCSKCRNCCKKLGISIRYDEIEYLNLTKEQLQNLTKEYGKYINKEEDCPFLRENNECSLKDNLPASCKEYPYTNKPERLERLERLFTVIDNTFIYPAVYEIMEELKKIYNFKKLR